MQRRRGSHFERASGVDNPTRFVAAFSASGTIEEGICEAAEQNFRELAQPLAE
jgi:hypothetical protein